MRKLVLNVTLLKTATYCLMHLVVAIAVAYALTRDWRVALAIGVLEPFVQTVFFALHDRFWAKYDGRGERAAKPSLHGACTHGGMQAAEMSPVRVQASPPAAR
jgi:uncharacterized membrane protein